MTLFVQPRILKISVDKKKKKGFVTLSQNCREKKKSPNPAIVPEVVLSFRSCWFGYISTYSSVKRKEGKKNSIFLCWYEHYILYIFCIFETHSAERVLDEQEMQDQMWNQ